MLRGDGVGEPAPVLIGEFGTSAPNVWWRHVLRYIREGDLDWAYWSLNGEKRLHESESFGLMGEDARSLHGSWRLRALQELMGDTEAA